MYKRLLLSLLLCLLPALAALAAPLKPNSGLWWEEPVTGRFYSVEIAPSGKTFVVVSEFDEQGQPVWRSMRGQLQLSSEAEQLAGAPLASFSAPLMDLDGACPSCPVSAPNVQPSPLGEARIVFLSHAEAEFQQGAIRRPLRYFSPADQPEDFPAARLAGAYTFAAGSGSTATARTAVLETASDTGCTRFEGNRPAANALLLRGNCQAGICDSANGGIQLSQLLLAVGPGEHPEIRAYQRKLAPEARLNPTCGSLFPQPFVCTCPSTHTLTRDPETGTQICLRNDAPLLCTESHRITEQAGVIRGLPLRDDQPPFTLFPTED
ncbi:MAG: hypothetical protein AB7E72_19450 [Lysobacterales bacterium]